MGCRTSSEAGAPRQGPPDVRTAEQVSIQLQLEQSLEATASKLTSTFSVASTEPLSVSTTSRVMSLAASLEAQNSSVLGITNTLTFNSQAHFMDQNQTIIIFDWDDTLCPSTWMRDQNRGQDQRSRYSKRNSEQTKQQLKTLSDQVIRLLQLARIFGRVVMVTNARRPWVHTSCANLLPDVHAQLKNVPIFYAMEHVVETDRTVQGQELADYLTRTKASAMKSAVGEYYSRYPGQSWKNIISLGDAFFEHDAIRQVTADHQASQPKKIRTKTIKLLEGPTIDGLIIQLSIVESWLKKVVEADLDVDIDFSLYEKNMARWVEMFGPDGAQVQTA